MSAAQNAIADRLLDWYDRHRRDFPWRAPPGGRPDPYAVWLSEIMLQQTTTATVAGYFPNFLDRWPTVEALAAAPLDAVLHAWQGLGYYARARNLHKCAQMVARTHRGRFPETEEALRRLPGVGAYTAAAIAAIAFDRPAVVVDGNVERVVSRLFAVEAPLPGARAELRAAAAAITPGRRPGDYAQAMMDLGATICTPRKPRCMLCPLTDLCAGRRSGIAESLPRRDPKPDRPVRHGIVFWVERPDGAILLRRRPENGLLGGMMEVPSTGWRDETPSCEAARAEAPLAAEWTPRPGLVQHVFTHFRLELRMLAGRVPLSTPAPDNAIWAPADRLGDFALPTVMKKVVAHGLRTG